jgi:hypothetical protein
MKLHKKYFSIALIGLVCLTTGCGQGESAQSAIPPEPTTTTLPVDRYPQTQIYFAPDIDLMTRDRVRITVAAAEELWGPVKDLEMWVTGLDPVAALTLRDEFCVIRKKTETESNHCEYKADRNEYLFVDFALQSRKPSKTIDDGPFAFFYPFSRPSGYIVLPYPSGLATKWPTPSEFDQTVIFHEYFHAVQDVARNLVDLEIPADSELMTGWFKEAFISIFKAELHEPKWFSEGLAMAMSEHYVPLLRKEGKLDAVSDKGSIDPDEIPTSGRYMMKYLWQLEDLLEEEPELRLKNSGDSEIAQAPYIFGVWAIQYLMVEHSREVFLNDFYPAISELGWEKAFFTTFGKSIDQFYSAFDRFIGQTTDELAMFLIYEDVED